MLVQYHAVLSMCEFPVISNETVVMCGNRLAALADKFRNLSRSFFDIDTASMMVVDTLCDAVAVVAHAVRQLLPPSLEAPPLTVILRLKDHGKSSIGPRNRFHFPLRSICSKLANGLIQTPQSSSTDAQAVSGSRLSTEHRKLGIIKMVKLQLGVPLSLPPFFFRSGNSTSVQLSLDPSSAPNSEVLVPCGADLTLRVEGVLRQPTGQNSRLLHRPKRDVRAVAIRAICKAIPHAVTASEQQHTCIERKVINRVVQLVDKGFSLVLLIPMPTATVPGQRYEIAVDCSLQDNDGVRWDLNVSENLKLKMVAPTSVHKNEVE